MIALPRLAAVAIQCVLALSITAYPGRMFHVCKLAKNHAAAAGIPIAIHRTTWLSSAALTAHGTVKEHPYRKIIGELLEAMFLTGGHEQQCASLNPVPFGAVEEAAFTSRNDIYLIARVRRLMVSTLRRIELRFERAMREDRHG